LGHKFLLVEDASLRLSQLLGELSGTMVDGGDEAVGCGVDGHAEIVIFEE